MRINIEDKLFLDYRFRYLTTILGSEDKALMLCYRFWRAAIEYYGKRELMPEITIKHGGFHAIVEVGLAEIVDGHVYTKGADTHFGWYLDKQASAQKAGRISAQRPRDGKGRLLPKTKCQNPTQTQRSLDSLDGNCPTRPALSNAPTPTPTPDFTNVKSPLYPPSGEEEAANEGSLDDQENHPQVLVDLWNAGSSAAQAKVRKLRRGTPRWKSAKARLQENPNIDEWKTVIRTIAKNEFCNGANDRQWIADFDFLIRTETFDKALEGKYGGVEKREEVATTNESNLLDLSRRKVLDLSVFERYRK